MTSDLKISIIRLLKRGKTYREIGKQVNCAHSTVAYWSHKSGIQSKNIPKVFTKQKLKDFAVFYSKHSAQATASYFGISKTTILRHCPKKKRKLLSKKELDYRNYYRVKLIRQERKIAAIAYKGGKCELCGYNKCIASLDFHHKLSTKKSFALSDSRQYLKWSKVLKELDKCLLVCANCHREIHYNEKNRTNKDNRS